MKRRLVAIAVLLCCASCGSKTEPAKRVYSAAEALSEAVLLLSNGKQDEAEALLREEVPRHADDQRLALLRACCVRSRFNVEGATALLQSVHQLEPASVEGQCAEHVLALDADQDADRHFQALQAMVENHPADPLLRWMMAIQCRSRGDNEKGVVHFAKLLEQWSPGPVLVHQTYANLLDNLDQYEEALKHRRLAVRMEPASWSYDGLGNTLTHLEQYQEANDAHARAVALDPADATHWRNWGWGLLEAGRYSDAMLKFQKAVARNPKDYVALAYWGTCHVQLRNPKAGIEKYNEALEINPAYEYARVCRADVESRSRWTPVPKRKTEVF